MKKSVVLLVFFKYISVSFFFFLFVLLFLFSFLCSPSFLFAFSLSFPFSLSPFLFSLLSCHFSLFFFISTSFLQKESPYSFYVFLSFLLDFRRKKENENTMKGRAKRKGKRRRRKKKDFFLFFQRLLKTMKGKKRCEDFSFPLIPC